MKTINRTEARPRRRQFRITWIDCSREPKNPANPEFPNGMDVDMRRLDNSAFCRTELPYPAPRCGLYFVQCKSCGANAMLTTAGRRDDPRSVRFSCERSA